MCRHGRSGFVGAQKLKDGMQLQNLKQLNGCCKCYCYSQRGRSSITQSKLASRAMGIGQPSVSLWRLREQDATKVSDSVIKIDRSVADWVNISVGWDQFPFEPNLSKKISGKIDGSISPLCPDRVPLCPAAARSSSSLGQRQRCPGSHTSESQESLGHKWK